MKRLVVLALCLATGLSPPASTAAVLGPAYDAAGAAGSHGLLVPVQRRRCVPSRCGCSGSQPTWCTRDCRRDRICSCVRGRYVCSLYVGGR